MTVENWLKGQFQGIGTQIERSVLESAALSPIMAKPTAIAPIKLTDEVEDYIDDSVMDEAFARSLKYALSTLYYSMSAAITGGTKSEKRGNRSISIGGYPLTTKDREAFRALGDKLRGELGCEADEEVADRGGAFDATNLGLAGKGRRMMP